MSVSRTSRLRLATPYRSQKRSKVLRSLSLSKIDSLYSRGDFFILEIERQFDAGCY